MSWRDFQLPVPSDKIDKIDEMPPNRHVVDIVDCVDKGEDHKDLLKKSSRTGTTSPVVKAEASKGVATTPLDAKQAWRNPFAQGTPQARAESLRIIEAARRGEPI